MLELYHYPFTALGSDCNLYLYSPDPSHAEETAQAAADEVIRIEQRYSRYSRDSVLSGINQAALRGGTAILDEETALLTDYAFACHQKSGGLFDITSGVLRKAWDFSSDTLDALPAQSTIDALLPKVGMGKINWERPQLTFTVPGMELDFGGIGKEYASDRAAEVCVARGITGGLVDLGGDIKIIGPHPGPKPWTIGITDPHCPSGFLGNVELFDGALASSGDYERCIVIDGERYSHIISPVTGWPVRGLSAVSVTAERCIAAGSICTIAMLKGAGGIHWLADTATVPYLWVDGDGKRGGPLSLLPADDAE